MIFITFCKAQNNEYGNNTWYQQIIDEYERQKETEDAVYTGEADRYIDRPYYEKKECRYLNIISLDITNDCTLVKCQYQNTSKKAILSIGSDAYLYDRTDGCKYDILSCDEIPIYPDNVTVDKNTKLIFTIRFRPVPKSSTCIDMMIPQHNGSTFNVYKIDVTGAKHQAPSVKIVQKVVKQKEKKEKKTIEKKDNGMNGAKNETPGAKPEPKVKDSINKITTPTPKRNFVM